MKIACNGLFLTRPNTGISEYTRHLVRALATQRHRLTVYLPEPLPAEVALPAAVKTVVVPPSRPRLGRGLALDHWETADLAGPVAASGNAVYHAPYPTPPINLPMPVVMTVHDMIPWQRSAYRRGLRRRVKLGRQLAGIRAADRICTVSEAAATAVSRIALIPPAKISVTYEAVDPRLAKPVSPATVAKLRRHYHLRRPYLLYLGGFDERKNVRTLIDGFADSGLSPSHDLVLAGALTAPRSKLYADFLDLSRRLIAAGINDQTKTLGFIPAAEKPALLKGAAAFVFPSYAEGFGLPILEALTVGTPVATAATPTSRELFSGAFASFDPDRRTTVAKALRVVVRTPRQKGTAATARRVARQYSWPRTATATAAAYQAARKP